MSLLADLFSVTGALIFIEIERPEENDRVQLKQNKTQEVQTAIQYLKSTFWRYANSKDNDNEKFREIVSRCFKVQDLDAAILQLASSAHLLGCRGPQHPEGLCHQVP